MAISTLSNTRLAELLILHPSSNKQRETVTTLDALIREIRVVDLDLLAL